MEIIASIIGFLLAASIILWFLTRFWYIIVPAFAISGVMALWNFSHALTITLGVLIVAGIIIALVLYVRHDMARDTAKPADQPTEAAYALVAEVKAEQAETERHAARVAALEARRA